MSVIVVGVDGSDASMDALRFAAVEARLRGAPLRVVCGWSPPVTGKWPAGVVSEPEPFERAARQTVDAMITAIGSELEGVYPRNRRSLRPQLLLKGLELFHITFYMYLYRPGNIAHPSAK